MCVSAIDSHVRQWDIWCAHLPRDHDFRLVEPREIVGPPHRVGNDEGGRPPTSTSTACALDVVGRTWWHVPQHYSLQFAYIDAEFESRRARQCIDLTANELMLNRRCLRAYPLRCVLRRRHWNGIHRPVDRPVVVTILF